MIRTQSDSKSKLQVFRIILFLLFTPLLFSCDQTIDSSDLKNKNEIRIDFSIKNSSINKDNETYEDRIITLRLLVFDSKTKMTVFNDKLNLKGNKSEPIKLLRNKDGYDFYFVANEETGGDDFVHSLSTISNSSYFVSDKHFHRILYNNTFRSFGDMGFLMSARYMGVKIPEGDYPHSAPWHFNKSGNNNSGVFEVNLIRAMARVDVIFKNQVIDGHVDVGVGKKITSVQLRNVPKYYSVPPSDNYYDSAIDGLIMSQEITSFDNFDYCKDLIGKITFYVPEFLLQNDDDTKTELIVKGKNFTEKIIPLNHEHFNDYEQSDLRDLDLKKISKYSIIRNTHYIVNFTLKSEEIDLKILPWINVDINENPYGSRFDVQVKTVLDDPKPPNIVKTIWLPYHALHPVTVIDPPGGNDDDSKYPSWVKECKLYDRNKTKNEGDTEGFVKFTYIKTDGRINPPYYVIKLRSGNLIKSVEFMKRQ